MHGFRWKFMAPSSSRARNSVMKIAERSSLKILPSPNTSSNTLRPRQHGRHFADDIFKLIFLSKNVWISIDVSLKYIPKCPICNIPALDQIMAWRPPGDKPLSEPMVVSLLTHGHIWDASLGLNELIHWGRVAHIRVSKLTIIGSDNGFSPGRCQAIIWTSAGILLTGPLQTNFSEILIGIHTFLFQKTHLKLLSVKWRPLCLGLNVLTSGASVVRCHLSSCFKSHQLIKGRVWNGCLDN